MRIASASDNGHCVGKDGSFFPKERGTGFREDTCTYVNDQNPSEVWHWYYLRERAQGVQATQEQERQLPVASHTSLINHDATFKPLADVSVAPFLEARGFTAIDAMQWRLAETLDWQHWMPHVIFSIKCHEEAGPHTWYAVQTELVSPDSGRKLAWKAPRRLVHLRELHDHLKKLLGSEFYDKMFVDRTGARVQFALRGGVSGTTSRLHCWFAALAAAMNAGRVSPIVVALVLHFLRAPPVPSDEEDVGETVEEAVWSPSFRFEAEDVPTSPHPHQTGELT